MKAELLAGKRGLVLGVSSHESVGFHVAEALRAQGAEVAVTVRPQRTDALAELADSGYLALELDALDEGSMERAVARAAERFEGLDFVVHTLVHVPQGALERPVTHVSASELAAAMDVGVRSLLAVTRYARPWLERSSSPRIVALLSGGADFAMPSYHLVGMVKAALGAAVRYLAAELGPSKILCNAVNFSMLETAAALRVIGGERTRQTRQHLAKRSMTQTPLDYADVTNAVTFLASPLCSNLTGEALVVDGGFSRSYF